MGELLAPDCDSVLHLPSEEIFEQSTGQELEVDDQKELSSLQPGMPDIGIQCCCELEPVSPRTIAVQTEDVCHVNEDSVHVPLAAQNEPYHVPLSVDAEERKVLKVHSFSLPSYPLSAVFPTVMMTLSAAFPCPIASYWKRSFLRAMMKILKE